MPTTKEKWQEIANRGLQDNFDPETRAKFDEAVSRGLITLNAQNIQQEPSPEIQQTPIQSPQPEPSFVDSAIGGAESVASILSGVVAEPISGIVGLADAMNPFAPEGAGGARVEQVREALTYQPRTQQGQAEIATVGGALEPIGKAISDFEESVGAGALEATGSPALAALAKALPAATAELLTLGTLAPAIATTKQIPKQGVKAVKRFARQSATKEKIAKLIDEGSTNVETAKFKLGTSMTTGKIKAVKDVKAVEAIKQNFDEGVVAAIKGSSKADKMKMLEMVDVMEKGKKNSRFAILSRPSDVAGDSLMSRFKEVTKANRGAGKNLDVVAKGLKGKKIDHSSAINSFIDDLDSMGVTFDAGIKPNFKGSDIEGLDAPIKAINQIVNRLKSAKSTDAFRMHQLKRFIDENVTHGKAGEGLKGRTERVLKKLRANVDGLLDKNFPKYDEVNTKYAETIGAIDAIQDVAGKKMNLTGANADKAVGTLLRRLMSNQQSRVRLLDSVNEIEGVAKKYGASFNDDLLTQVLFVDELDSVFGTTAKTSFQGQIRQAIPTSKSDAVIKTAEKLADKVRNINPEAGFKAIRELLKE